MSRSQRRGLSEKEETLSHDLAMLAGFSQGAVEDAFIAQNKRDMLGEGRLCPKCKERRVEEGEEYCWNCQVDLFQSFRKAASEIKQDSEKAKKARSQSSESTSMLIQLQEKMARTGSNRTNMLDTRPTRY